MKVDIRIEITLDELNEFIEDYERDNGKKPNFEIIKRTYIDWFIADKTDYIDPDKIDVYFT